MNEQQYAKISSGRGFIAALDQSGGSTPKALRLYGIADDAYPNDDEMFDLIHEMRTRIITSPTFTGDRILGAILFEMTMDRQIEGMGSGRVPVEGEARRALPEGRQGPGRRGRRRPGDEADARPRRPPGRGPISKGVFGTKMRSVIKLADADGRRRPSSTSSSRSASEILAAGLVPIIEPEVDIHSPQKAEAEALLKAAMLCAVSTPLPDDQQVMLKLTLPDGRLLRRPGRTTPACCGWWPSPAATAGRRPTPCLARNHGVVASFSRALTEGLTAQQSDAEFDAALDASIASIFEASMT